MDESNVKCDKCGQDMAIKEGRFGKFLACTGYPDCRNTKQVDETGGPDMPATTKEKCPECSQPLQAKRGRFGPFFGCTGYPDCRYIKNIEIKTGATCPQCHQGDIVEKHSRAGKIFYSCNKYPACKFALWSKPTGDKCPNCQSLLVHGSVPGTIKCSSEGCQFQKTLEK